MTLLNRRTTLILLSIPFISFLSGCGKQNQFMAPPPPQVDVQAPLMGETTVYLETSGRLQASERVKITARVTGFLKSVEFEAGNYVNEGDLLFTIEPDEFDAAVRTAEAKLEKAKADQQIAAANLKKRKDANRLRAGAVSDLELLSAEADVAAAKAVVSIEEAALADAVRRQGYTKIHAPISGRISNAKVDIGNLVGAEPTVLTEIVKVKPIYMNVEFNERGLLPYLPTIPNSSDPEGEVNGEEVMRLELGLILSDGSEYDEVGKFDFIDNTIDPETGTIRSRAEFPNEQELLADGLFGRLRIPKPITDAVRVPSFAIQRDLGGSFVLLVNNENQVVRRTVIPTEFSQDEYRLIEPYQEEKGTGLQADDKIIVSNLQRAREGITVVPSESGAANASPPDTSEEPAPDGQPEAPEEGKTETE